MKTYPTPPPVRRDLSDPRSTAPGGAQRPAGAPGPFLNDRRSTR